MSGAVISNNVSIKISAAISATSGTSGSTLYTAPATGYAIINAILGAGTATSAALRVGGRDVFSVRNFSGEISSTVFGGLATATESTASVLPSASTTGIMVGPGQSVTLIAFSGSNSIGATISGVEFINSP